MYKHFMDYAGVDEDASDVTARPRAYRILSRTPNLDNSMRAIDQHAACNVAWQRSKVADLITQHASQERIALLQKANKEGFWTYHEAHRYHHLSDLDKERGIKEIAQ